MAKKLQMGEERSRNVLDIEDVKSAVSPSYLYTLQRSNTPFEAGQHTPGVAVPRRKVCGP